MSRNVLVIEDDKDIARLLDLHLKDEGYSVTVVSDGKAGLRQALAKPYDLVILDLILHRRLAGAVEGFGLVIARRILELHGSYLSAESAVGAGSTFEFTLQTAPPSTTSI
ncbi:MAG: hypothetical protein A2X88_10050 [Deltaproteobacteria bacterium GWC2_65_14]|nr:MAG: hypothetical protein A2X88_10050 [Deltaproteobacteria bacterium GWC2_65_14]